MKNIEAIRKLDNLEKRFADLKKEIDDIKKELQPNKATDTKKSTTTKK